MDKVFLDKDMVSDRISKIIDNLIQNHSVFQNKLDKTKISELYTNQMLKQWTPEQVMEISEDELTSILNDLMVFEALSGLLNDLTIEQIKFFDAAVEGR